MSEMESTYAFLRADTDNKVLAECLIADGRLAPMPSNLPRILGMVTKFPIDRGPPPTSLEELDNLDMGVRRESRLLEVDPGVFIGGVAAWLALVTQIRKDCSGPIDEITRLALRDEDRIAVVRKAKKGLDEKQAAALAEELRKTITGGLIETLGDAEPSFNADGILTWDGILADLLASIGGEKGDAYAQDTRSTAAKKRAQWEKDHKAGGLWSAWHEDKYARMLAQALWPAVKARIESEKARLEREGKRHPAMLICIARPINDLLNRNIKLPEDHNGQRILPINDGKVMVRICNTIEGKVIEIIEKDFKKLGTLTCHKLIHWAVETGHSQLDAGIQDPRYYHIEGGKQTFGRDHIGLKSKREIEDLGDLLDLLHMTEIPIPPTNAYSQILMRTIHPAKGNFKGAIDLIFGLPILPPYSKQWAEIRPHLDQYQKRLVPFLHGLPPMIGRDNEKGAQATLSMRLVAHMTDLSPEFAQHGGIIIDEEVLATLAKGLPLPSHMLRPLLECWKIGDDSTPALLKQVDKNRVTLGDAHATARTFITNGGQMRETGRVAGEKGGEKRRAKIKRLAGTK